MADWFIAYWIQIPSTRSVRGSPPGRINIDGIFRDIETAKRWCETEHGQGPPTRVPMVWTDAGEDTITSEYPNGPVFIQKTHLIYPEDF